MESIGISGITPSASFTNWRRQLAEAIRDPDELCQVLDLPNEVREAARRAARWFPLLVPRGFVARMTPRDPADPLLRQVLPLDAEGEEAPGFVADPVGDGQHLAAPGLLRKYARRALLMTSGVCAVHCRYCFRRHYPYEQAPRGLDAWEPALSHLAMDQTLDEVILSGGDPLTLTDEWLARLAKRLATIPHLRRLRVHTRLPIVLPERVTDELLNWITSGSWRPIVVIHCNHPRELDLSTQHALRKLVEANIMVLNQAVLLRGVNDNVTALEELSLLLLDLGVIPYYLHQLDRVAGAAHFEVSENLGRMLVAELARRLPGYAVPRYVREIEGAEHKVPL